MILPNSMKNKKLYPSISMGSREDKVFINIGQEGFIFDLTHKIEVIKMH